mgnify:CR=1 FL=1
MEALRVYIQTRANGYGLKHDWLSFKNYSGLLGRLGMEKVELLYHLKDRTWAHFDSLDNIAKYILQQIQTVGWYEVHLIPTFGFINRYSIQKKVLAENPNVKFANPIRQIALPLEEFLRIFYEVFRIDRKRYARS